MGSELAVTSSSAATSSSTASSATGATAPSAATSSSAARARPREADLQAAATRLFRERGYHATSMEDLAQALRMTRGSLYHYIVGKDELLWLILGRAFDRLEARVVPILESRMPPLDRLRGAIHEHLRVAAEHADELSLIQIELRSLPPERRARMIERRDAYEALWRGALGEAMADGSLRAFDVRLAGIGILSACNWFTQWYRPGGSMSVDEVADRFCDLFLTGLAPRDGGAAYGGTEDGGAVDGGTVDGVEVDGREVSR